MARHKKKWNPTVIKGKKMQDIAEWLNNGADFDKSGRTLDFKYVIKTKQGNKPNHITEFGEGYSQAITDVFKRLGLDFV